MSYCNCSRNAMSHRWLSHMSTLDSGTRTKRSRGLRKRIRSAPIPSLFSPLTTNRAVLRITITLDHTLVSDPNEFPGRCDSAPGNINCLNRTCVQLLLRSTNLSSSEVSDDATDSDCDPIWQGGPDSDLVSV